MNQIKGLRSDAETMDLVQRASELAADRARQIRILRRAITVEFGLALDSLMVGPRCWRCGTQREALVLTIDPFDDAIFGDTSECWICMQCWNVRCDQIVTGGFHRSAS